MFKIYTINASEEKIVSGSKFKIKNYFTKKLDNKDDISGKEKKMIFLSGQLVK